MVKESDIDEGNHQPKKDSDLVKFLKKRSFIYLACAVVFVVFFVPEMLQPSDFEKMQIEKCEGEGQIIACEIISSYKGTNDEGSNLRDMLMTQIEKAYDTERILKHKDTTYRESAINIQDQKGIGFYEVHFTIQHTMIYDTEKILKHKDTTYRESAINIQDQKGIGFYEVHFIIQTYDDTRDYVWHVNIDTKEIIPVNSGAKKMQNIVDNYD